MSNGDSVIIFAPEGSSQDDKSSKAEDFAGEICRASNMIQNYEFDEMIACLSGGIRALILGVISALLTLDSYRIVIELEFENLKNYAKIPLHTLKIPYNNRWLTVLEYLEPEKSFRTILKEV